MTKAQLVDFACDFFEDEGNLRQEMETLNSKQLVKLLFEHDAHEAPGSQVAEVPEFKTPPATGPLDLGSG